MNARDMKARDMKARDMKSRDMKGRDMKGRDMEGRDMNRQIVTGRGYRFAVLTDRMIRMEYQKEGHFEDRPSQMAVNRCFAEPAFEVRDEESFLEIETDALLVRYDRGPFSSNGLSVTLKETQCTWNYSVPYGNSDENLFGTARTLDETDGYTNMGLGIFGKRGYAILNDSSSPVMDGGEYVRREHNGLDLYFFGYGRDFLGGLKDFYALSGKTPLIPRYALGNWWSRYYRYSADSYMELLEHFQKEEIPLSVAVLDMDWHVTAVDQKYGTGWTGFTWDRELFPDYRAFLKKLKEKGVAVTLNLHPADGIRAFEDMYGAVAERMGIDPTTEQAVEFDFSDAHFREVYFEEVLHPYERDGVDFWWIDWQQGTGGDADVDPLLLLNHFHYMDQLKNGKRPMVFSRYAGPGSHRYPIGFSGDTVISWRSLHFQPPFTSTASNIGYGWWSHDIGGHMLGDKSDERLIRWIQYGVFSPIMRIHSSNSPFNNKEPWTLEEPYRQIAGEYMRLRHRMVPYLYTAVRAASEEGLPLIQPLYYAYPEEREAYETPEGYQFGPSLLVMPVTGPEDPSLKLGAVSGWIPEGRWVDLFTGQVYRKKGKHRLYRALRDIPVLLKAGGIVPLFADSLQLLDRAPEALQVLLGAGADGSYELYEDDGISMRNEAGEYALTGVEMRWENSLDQEGGCSCTIRVLPVRGDEALLPALRRYTFVLAGAAASAATRAYLMKEDGNKTGVSLHGGSRWPFPETDPVSAESGQGLVLRIEGLTLAENDRERMLFDILNRAWIDNLIKEGIFGEWRQAEDEQQFLSRLAGLDVPETLKDAVREIFL